MNLYRVVFIVILSVAGWLPSRPAEAWHGYPPYGAWAYGGYSPVVGHARTRIVYRTRSVWPARSYGWGSYGNLGFSATTRVRYRGLYRSHISYRTPWINDYISYPRAFYPRYSFGLSAFHFYPINYFSYPDIGVPGCFSPAVYSVSRPVIGAPVYDVSADYSSFSPASVATEPTLVAEAATIEGMPPALLAAADSILRAGGYTEAAIAYAELSVRFGTSNVLLGRRFVAQVASGDLAQAEIIVELSGLSNMPILALDLPGGSLVKLLGSTIVEDSSERLAAHSLADPSDATRLKSVATWLALAGDQSRAILFSAQAQKLTENETQMDTPHQEIGLVSFE